MTLGAFSLGLMAKPMVVTLPVVLLLLDYWPLGRLRFRQNDMPRSEAPAQPVQKRRLLGLVREKAPFFALTAASSIVTLYAQQKGGAVSSVKAVPIFFRVINALRAYVLYLAKMVWPVDLAVLYPLPPTLTIAQGLFAGLFVAGISILVLRLAKRHPYFLTGWLWYLVTLLPVIGLVQVGSQSMADRYSYLPLIGIFIMVAWGLRLAAGNKRIRQTIVSAVAIALVAACAMCTWFQLGYWKNSITLFSHAAEVVPDNFIAHEALGLVLAKSGRLDEAVSQYSESLRIWPDYDRALIGMGNVLVREGRLEEAAGYAERALRLKPGLSEAHFLLGFIRMQQGRNDEALRHYFAGLRTDPENAGIHHIVGVILGSQGKLNESIEQFNEALRLKPDFAQARQSLNEAMRLKKKSP